MQAAPAKPALFAGVMTGTSLDAIDIAVIKVGETTTLGHVSPMIELAASSSTPLDSPLRSALMALQASGPDELHRSALTANALADAISRAVLEICIAQNIKPTEITALGVHGQTVRHQPAMGYTIQLNAPARIAETTGITVVSDFRSRDIAAGGQGAPLVPLFHQAIFGGSEFDAESTAELTDESTAERTTKTTAVVNIGGMANITWLGSPLIGFDTGPGNVLMDLWVQQHQDKAFDQNGQWAQSGQVHAELLNSFYADPFFKSPPPKSTGRDLFSAAWLDQHLNQPAFQKIKPQDVQATLAMLTAKSIANEIKRLEDQSAKDSRCSQVLVCGGGEKNQHLMGLLEKEIRSVLGQSRNDQVGQQKSQQIPVHSTAVRGWPPQVIESAAFAWLAYRTLHNLPGNSASVTGALGARILGSITPGAIQR